MIFFQIEKHFLFSSQQIEDMPHGMSQACMCVTFGVFMLIFFYLLTIHGGEEFKFRFYNFLIRIIG